MEASPPRRSAQLDPKRKRLPMWKAPEMAAQLKLDVLPLRTWRKPMWNSTVSHPRAACDSGRVSLPVVRKSPSEPVLQVQQVSADLDERLARDRFRRLQQRTLAHRGAMAASDMDALYDLRVLHNACVRGGTREVPQMLVNPVASMGTTTEKDDATSRMKRVCFDLRAQMQTQANEMLTQERKQKSIMAKLRGKPEDISQFLEWQEWQETAHLLEDAFRDLYKVFHIHMAEHEHGLDGLFSQSAKRKEETQHGASETVSVLEFLLEENGDLMDSFDKLDKNAAGFVTIHQWKSGLERMGFSGNATAVFRCLDFDQNNEVSRDEFTDLAAYLPMVVKEIKSRYFHWGIHDLRGTHLGHWVALIQQQSAKRRATQTVSSTFGQAFQKFVDRMQRSESRQQSKVGVHEEPRGEAKKKSLLGALGA